MSSSGGFEALKSHEVVSDPEAERIMHFMDALPQISKIDVITPDTNFEDADPIDYAKKRFLAYNYDKQPTLYLNPSLQVHAEKADDLSFTPLVARGGKRSAHGVFFGKLHVGDDEVAVAVKPHETSAFITGLDDYFKNQAIADLGFYSLTPAALLLVSEEQAYSLTVLEEDLTTLDSIDWSSYYPHTEENPGMQQTWRGISDQAALLHAQGNRSHGDLAARNIAMSTDGTVFFIDWEHARLQNNAPRDPETRFNQSYGDLSVLLESMCLPSHANIGGKAGIGIFYEKDCDWWEGFCEVFFDEYLTVRRELAKEGNHQGQVIRDVEEELEQLTRNLKEDIEMFREICDGIPPPVRSETIDA